MVAFSQKSKLHIDATAKHLKVEKLYHDIGKEYMGLRDRHKPTAKLKKLIEETEVLLKEEKSIKTKISKKKKSTPRKKSTKKS